MLTVTVEAVATDGTPTSALLSFCGFSLLCLPYAVHSIAYKRYSASGVASRYESVLIRSRSVTLLERRARACPQASLAAYCNASASIAHPFSNESQRLSPVFADVPAAARNQSQQQWPSTVRNFNSYARADIDGSQDKVERRTDLTEKEVSTRAPTKTSADARNSSAKAVKVKPASFYGSYGISKLLLVDQRVARLYANVQQRLLSQEQAPFEHFALQRQAFAWVEAHELAKDLKYVFGRICEKCCMHAKERIACVPSML